MFKTTTLAAGALLAALAAPAFATTVDITPADYGQWKPFDIDDFTSQSFGTEWIDTETLSPGYGTSLGFSFSIASGMTGTLTVVDGGFAGDTFQVFNAGVLLGSTSLVPVTDYDASPANAGLDFDAALGNAAFSRGVFTLGAGTYHITGTLAQSVLIGGSPFNATVGALNLTVTPVPEPSTTAMLIAGLGFLATTVRRRRS